MSGFDKRRKVDATRKDHDCLGCLSEIPSGSQAIYKTGKTEEGFYGYYLCSECDEYLKENGSRIQNQVWANCVMEMKIRNQLYGGKRR